MRNDTRQLDVHAFIKVRIRDKVGVIVASKRPDVEATQLSWRDGGGNPRILQDGLFVLPLVNIYPRCPHCSSHTQFFLTEARKPSPAGTTSTSLRPGPPPACPVGGKHTCGKTNMQARCRERIVSCVWSRNQRGRDNLFLLRTNIITGTARRWTRLKFCGGLSSQVTFPNRRRIAGMDRLHSHYKMWSSAPWSSWRKGCDGKVFVFKGKRSHPRSSFSRSPLNIIPLTFHHDNLCG